ncbi:MAG: SDR family oxidoreductase [Clostridia bacterium]|nr:SDR family oxidoreductase [Clostridia bacterium]
MNKVALITGGSKGIGRAISERFAKEGYNLIINYKEKVDIAEKLKNELEEKFSINVMLIRADLSNEESINQLVEEVIKAYGSIDVLVNNAGIAIDKEFEYRNVEDWENTLKVNLIAPFLLSKLIGQNMFDNKKGTIINISSTNGINTYYPTSIDYDASKAGLINLTHNLAIQFAPYVRVNCVAPGWVNTEMNKELPKDFINDETQKILLKRFAEPSEIANVVYFLASEDASFINSEVVKVDGGWN